MINRFRALAVALVAVLFTILMATLSIVLFAFDWTGRSSHRCEQIWSFVILSITQVRVRVKGLENLDPDKAYILAANHQSYFDIWALVAYIPVRFKFIAKSSLFKWPFLGWHLRLAGHIPIERTNVRASIKVLSQRAADIVRSGISVLVFPEGTRSTNGEIGPFKKASMLLAIDTGAPVVPIAISGSRRCLPRGSIISYPGVIDVVICKPIHSLDYSHKELAKLASTVRDKISDNYARN